jgi:hypothetical protein
MTNPPTMLDNALALARDGYKVFALIEGGKLPAHRGDWKPKATTDEAKIRAMWTDTDPVLGDRVRNYNIGVSTVGLLVLDVDNKKDKNGSKVLDDLCLLNDMPDTFTVRTPTGGFHYYFKPSASVCNSANKLGLGLDVRGDGGYVVGPGSTIVDDVDGQKVDGSYEVIDRAPVADAPAWLEQLAGRPRERSADAGKPATTADGEPLDLDTPHARQRAISWLQGIDPEKRPGTWFAAVKCKGFGLSALVTLEIMDEYWNGPIHPTMDFEALAKKVNNAYIYGKEPIGEDDPRTDFTDVPEVDIPTRTAPERPKLYAVSLADARPYTGQKWLVKNLLPVGGMSVIYGDSNTGKTAWMMALGYHVAGNKPFAGQKVTAGAVVYVAAEAGKSAESRAYALREYHRDDPSAVPFYLVPCSIDLCHGDVDVTRLADLIAETTAADGGTVLVVIDTLSRAMAGGDENGNVDMGGYVRNIDALRRATNAHVASVHHTGKDAAKGARGHSLLRAATDTEIEVADRFAKLTKQRDGATEGGVGFELKAVKIGKDIDGEDIDAVVAIPNDKTAAEDFAKMKAPLAGEDADVMALLKKAGGKAHKDVIRVPFVAARAKRVKGIDLKSHGTEFRRTVKNLVAQGYVVKNGDILETVGSP